MLALTVAGLLAAAWAYWRGVERLWRHAGRGAVVAPWQAASFAAGLGVVAVAVLPPLDPLAHELLTAHMVQHLLLVLLAPPLLVLGAPVAPFVWGAPRSWRRRLQGLRPPARLRSVLARPGWVVGAGAVHVGVLWIWHAPPLYEAAIANPVVHAAEHLTMLGSAVALWAGALATHGPRRRAHPAGALAMFLVATLTVGLGTLLVFAPAAWYPTYETAAAARGVDPLTDQQVAGALMWTFGGIGAMALGAVLIGVWLARSAQAGDGKQNGVHIP